LTPTTGIKRKKIARWFFEKQNAWSLEEKWAFCFSKHAPLGRYKIGIKETIHSPCQPITI